MHAGEVPDQAPEHRRDLGWASLISHGSIANDKYGLRLKLHYGLGPFDSLYDRFCLQGRFQPGNYVNVLNHIKFRESSNISSTIEEGQLVWGLGSVIRDRE